MSNSLPVNGVPEGNAPPKGFPRYWIVLGLLVLAHAAFGAYFNPFGEDFNEVGETKLFVMIGAILSQPILFAIWASFAPQRFVYRFLWSLLLCTLVAFAEELAPVRNKNASMEMLVLLDLTYFAVATIILSLFRWVSRWQLKQPIGEIAPSSYPKYQFGIKHLRLSAKFGGGQVAHTRCSGSVIVGRRGITCMWKRSRKIGDVREISIGRMDHGLESARV